MHWNNIHKCKYLHFFYVSTCVYTHIYIQADMYSMIHTYSQVARSLPRYEAGLQEGQHDTAIKMIEPQNRKSTIHGRKISQVNGLNFHFWAVLGASLIPFPLAEHSRCLSCLVMWHGWSTSSPGKGIIINSSGNTVINLSIANTNRVLCNVWFAQD